MKNKSISLFLISVVLLLAISACSGLAGLPQANLGGLLPSKAGLAANPVVQPARSANPAATGPASELLAAYEGVLENTYNQVNPSVVSIQVIEKQSVSAQQGSLNPFFDTPGLQNSPNTPQFSQALGSGFVWDTQGNIVTNNHVVDGADKIEVTFADGTSVPAKVVGKDPNADLAVIKVDLPADQLKPVQMADSTQVKVGELAIAVGNPFGEEGTMTVGIVSALGRSISATESQALGPGYSIPDIIQTDAPINPGNSGGVLVNDQGQVIGVTAAIESPVQASSGIGFAIPSSIVQKVVPELIKNGVYRHPYLGISGTTLTPDLASAMKLPDGTHGALVMEVSTGGPADKAGLRGSTSQTTINGQDIPVGGDVITAIDGQPVKKMEDLIAYLYSKTEIGQKVKLSLLRDGKAMDIVVNLQARPEPSASVPAVNTPSGT